jgi:hypothetical protein
MFLIQGVLAVFALASLLWRATLWKRIVVGLLALTTLYLVMSTEVRLRSGTAWWQDPLWRNIILFVLLLLGMMFRVVWEALERRTAKAVNALQLLRPSFSGWDFVRPALVSLIVFQGVLLLAKTQELSWELALASFQNGFFWNTLFGHSRAAVEGGQAEPKTSHG